MRVNALDDGRWRGMANDAIPLHDTGPNSGYAEMPEKTQGRAHTLFTSRAEVVLKKYEPQTHAARSVVVDPAGFKDCACCFFLDHNFKGCPYNKDQLCKNIFFENLDKLKPGLSERRGNRQ